MKILLIEWDDSSHYNTVGWVHKDEADEYAKAPPLRCQSVGFLMGENSRSVTLAESVSATQAAELIKIPKSAIRWREELTPPFVKHAKRRNSR